MKHKAPLSMMEQMVMIAVFALCAALCLQAFVTSDRLSRRAEERDRAVLQCQTVAETVRHAGSVDVPLAEGVHVQALDSGLDGLGQARVWAEDENGQVLFELTVAWQREVSGNG